MVLSTIGIGDLVPTHSGTKIFFIFFAFIGICLESIVIRYFVELVILTSNAAIGKRLGSKVNVLPSSQPRTAPRRIASILEINSTETTETPTTGEQAQPTTQTPTQN
jgi:hypothetical protein